MNNNIKKTANGLGTEPIGKLLWRYSVPAITGTVVMALYNIVDRMFIGLGVGAMAISGLALTFPFISIMTAFSMLVGIGASARLSIRLGENDIEKAEKILGNAFTLTFIVSAIFTIFSMLFLKDILILLGGSENTLEYAVEYMKIVIPATIISALMYNFNNIMRSSGYPMKAMYTMIISALVNVILDALFIFVFDMGIQGAAYATVISYFVASIWVLSHFMGKDRMIRFKKKYFTLENHIVKSILSIGVAPFSMQIAGSIVVMLLNFQLLKYGGDLAVGALGIVNSISLVTIMIIIGLNQGAQPILGFSYGAKNIDRMFSTIKRTITIATAVTTVGFIICFFFPEWVIRFFTTDKELKNISIVALKISVVMFPLVGSQIVISNFFQSIGKAKIAMLLSLTRQVLFLIPLLIFVPRFFELNGVWASLPISDTLAVIVTTIVFILSVRKIKQEDIFQNISD